MDNDTHKNYDALIGRMDKITDQRAMILQMAKEYKMEEERRKNYKACKRMY